jgi:hypothetical protein
MAIRNEQKLHKEHQITRNMKKKPSNSNNKTG